MSRQDDENVILMIKGAISELPPEQRSECNKLIGDIEVLMLATGEPMATLEIALIGAKKQLEVENDG